MPPSLRLLGEVTDGQTGERAARGGVRTRIPMYDPPADRHHAEVAREVNCSESGPSEIRGPSEPHSAGRAEVKWRDKARTQELVRAAAGSHKPLARRRGPTNAGNRPASPGHLCTLLGTEPPRKPLMAPQWASEFPSIPRSL